MYSNGPPRMAEQKQDDQLEHIYSSYKGCSPEDPREAMNDRSGERGTGISVLIARHEDDDEVKLVIKIEGDPKAPFSIATTPRYRRGFYSFPWIVQLYP